MGGKGAADVGTTVEAVAEVEEAGSIVPEETTTTTTEGGDSMMEAVGNLKHLGECSSGAS